ncbi:MAG: hypothetical protein ACLU0A_00630 [Roseburia sp.]|nr:hypothetical protein [Lachnospiraceae bacterium]
MRKLLPKSTGTFVCKKPADKSSIRSKQPERQPNFKKNTAREVLRILTS